MTRRLCSGQYQPVSAQDTFPPITIQAHSRQLSSPKQPDSALITRIYIVYVVIQISTILWHLPRQVTYK
jgi:hypothetical protein